ncbi:protein-disulfide reductase DsbD domain-containing protein [Palleronia sp.]|uniref:protein-disulfide reductase DsbD domain-containing protein n=1 Tax=Palleronia sp. TaxID=1940284 RepID=UPI0035C8092D
MRHFLLLMILALLPSAAHAESHAVEGFALLPGWRMEDGRHMAGLEIRLAPGWKTYWRRPGEAGIPPSFDWSGSQNVAAVRIHWPVPSVIRQSGMRSVVYKDHVILPIEVTPKNPTAPAVLRLDLDMGVCKDVCVPVEAEAEVDLSPAPVRPDARIRTALADRPFTEGEVGLARAGCDVRLAPGGEARLTVQLNMPPLGAAEEIVFEPSDPELWVSEPRAHRQDGALVAVADLAAPRGRPLVLDRDALRITVLGDQGAAEIIGCD